MLTDIEAKEAQALSSYSLLFHGYRPGYDHSEFCKVSIYDGAGVKGGVNRVSP
jgi:hypothetical protein